MPKMIIGIDVGIFGEYSVTLIQVVVIDAPIFTRSQGETDCIKSLAVLAPTNVADESVIIVSDKLASNPGGEPVITVLQLTLIQLGCFRISNYPIATRFKIAGTHRVVIYPRHDLDVFRFDKSRRATYVWRSPGEFGAQGQCFGIAQSTTGID